MAINFYVDLRFLLVQKKVDSFDWSDINVGWITGMANILLKKPRFGGNGSTNPEWNRRQSNAIQSEHLPHFLNNRKRIVEISQLTRNI